ncbi:MAG: immunity 42 family protein [Ruminococcus sp.]|nr:immunity 42 family protein [Ruminococcus sp.]MDE6848933.1 immunity 42 family protein [Ruminococcus sp.]
MIIGNPDCFAVIVDVVESWNVDKSFQNGILFLAISAEIFPKEIQSATLSYEFAELTESLKNIPVGKEIFSMPNEKAYNELYNLVYPDDWDIDSDYRYMISTPSFYDKNYLVFAVSNGEKIRILAARPDYCKEESICILENVKITETFIDVSELNDIIDKLSVIDIRREL